MSTRTTLLLAALLALLTPAGASATVGCTVDGPTVHLTATDFAEGVAVARAGRAIEVKDDRTGLRVACSEPEPTVDSVDVIDLTARGEESFLYLDLAGGRLAPGASEEAERTSEIEVDVDWPSGFLGVGGSGRDDVLGFGSDGRRTLAYLTIDPDAEVTAPDLINVLARGRGGDDRIAGFSFEDDGVSVELAVSATFEGGGGNDFLSGGSAPDVLAGGTGKDLIFPGRGPDSVDCGPGRDRVVGSEPRDGLSQCERVVPR